MTSTQLLWYLAEKRGSTRRRRLAVAVVACFALCAAVPESSDDSNQAEIDVARQALREIADHSEHMPNLQYLADTIGSRLTGSPELTRASRWTAERFRAYGLSNVHLEPFKIAHSWRRGTTYVEVVSPMRRRLRAEAAGWSPNTNGLVRGRVVYIEAADLRELVPHRGTLRGAIVLLNRVLPKSESETIAAAPSARQDDYASVERIRRFRVESAAFFKKEGAVAVFRESDKPFDLFDMSYAASRFYEPSPVPVAYLTHEDFELIWRLIRQKSNVKVDVDIRGCVFSEGKVEVYNTVAEIPGSSDPAEAVIVGAHLDSWDLATGSTDNAAGVAAILEAARALQKVGIRPRRTIRFVLFVGEEQGMQGAEAYVKEHQQELSRISAVLVHDDGTGRVTGLGLQDNPQVAGAIDDALRPFRDVIGPMKNNMSSAQGSDHAVFDRAGVPGFYCVQDPLSYDRTHHSQADTLDKINNEGVLQGAQVVAVFAYRTAQQQSLLPRRNHGPQ